MKISITSALLITILSGVGYGGVSIVGIRTIGLNFRGTNGASPIPVGSHFMIVADSQNDGILANSVFGHLNASTDGYLPARDPIVTSLGASISPGGTFGGDFVLSTGTVANSSIILMPFDNTSIAGQENKRFALIWFEKSASTLLSEGLIGQKYGVLSLEDWILPSVDSGSFTMSASDASGTASYYSGGGGALTSQQLGSTGFFTGSGTAGGPLGTTKYTSFTLVPEPSVMAFGVFGMFGLLCKRSRNHLHLSPVSAG